MVFNNNLNKPFPILLTGYASASIITKAQKIIIISPYSRRRFLCSTLPLSDSGSKYSVGNKISPQPWTIKKKENTRTYKFKYIHAECTHANKTIPIMHNYKTFTKSPNFYVVKSLELFRADRPSHWRISVLCEVNLYNYFVYVCVCVNVRNSVDLLIHLLDRRRLWNFGMWVGFIQKLFFRRDFDDQSEHRGRE